MPADDKVAEMLAAIAATPEVGPDEWNNLLMVARRWPGWLVVGRTLERERDGRWLRWAVHGAPSPNPDGRTR